MTTVINNPGGEGGSGVGIIVGVVLAIAIIAIFFIYGLPALRNNNGGTNINVPDKIQVDINTD